MANREFRARLYAEVGQYVRQMREATSETAKVGVQAGRTSKDLVEASRKMEAAGKKMADVGKKATIGITLPLLAIAKLSVDAASDLQEATSKNRVLFGEQADQMEQWAERADASMGMSKRAALDAAGSVGAMLDAMGFATPVASRMSMEMAQLAGDMASFHNDDPSEMLDRLRAGLSGESEPLKRFGVLLTAAAVEAKAVKMGLSDASGQVSEAAKVQARYAIIMDQTASSQGDFVRTSDGLASSSRNAKAELENAAAVLGEQLIPMALDVVDVVSDAVGWFGRLDSSTQQLVVRAAMLAAVLGPVASVGGKVVRVLGSATKAVDGLRTAGQMVQAAGGMRGVATILASTGAAGQIAATGGIALAIKGLDMLADRFEFHADVAKLDAALADFAQSGKVTGEMARALDGDLANLSQILDDAAYTGSGVGAVFVGLSEGLNKITLGMVDIDTTGQVAEERLAALGASIERMVAVDPDQAAQAYGRLIMTAYLAGNNVADLEGRLGGVSQALSTAGISTAAYNSAILSGASHTDALASAQTDAGNASGTLEGGLDDVAEAATTAASEMDEAIKRLQDWTDQQRAAADPAFALVKAMQDRREAEEDLAETLKDAKATDDDLLEARLKLVEAELDVEDAAAKANGTLGGAQQVLDRLRREGKLTASDLDDLRVALDGAASAVRNLAGNYSVQLRYETFGGVPNGDGTVSVAPGVTVPRGVLRARGGETFAGNPYVVGEDGPELFVPAGSGRIIPSGQTRQIVDNRSTSSTSLVQNVTAIVRDGREVGDLTREMRHLAGAN